MSVLGRFIINTCCIIVNINVDLKCRVGEEVLIRGLRVSEVEKKAMIRNRYNRIPHPVLNTKRERDTYN